MDRILRKLAPLTAVVVVLASAGAHAQMSGSNSLNPGIPGLSSPQLGGGFSPGFSLPGSRVPSMGTQSSGLSNPRISNYGAGGTAREPGSLPRFH
jgi:hypothetical protein